MLASVRRQIPQCGWLDTAAALAEALDRLDDLVKRTGATITSPDSWPAAVGCQPRVVHIWTNYIGNAAKYAGPNAQISLGATEDADRRIVKFWVRDAGPGLSPEAQRSLFVPFAQLSALRVAVTDWAFRSCGASSRNWAGKPGLKVSRAKAPFFGSNFRTRRKAEFFPISIMKILVIQDEADFRSAGLIQMTQ